MKRVFFMSILMSISVSAFSQRTVEDWNFEWKFHLGKLPAESIVNPSTTDWEDVDLPHDYQIIQPWEAPKEGEERKHLDGGTFATLLSARGFKPLGEGWYVKKFIPTEEMRNKRVLLDFEGILYVADVYLNGERVGGTDYGYVGFECNITDKLKFGQTNVITVHADTKGPYNSRWYTGAGIYRNVQFITTNKELYFARHPLQIITKDNKYVNISAEIFNKPGEEFVSLGVILRTPSGDTIYSQRAKRPYFSPLEAHEFETIPSDEVAWEQIEIANPELWCCETPNLYTAEATLYDKNDKEVDKVTEKFGIRTVEFGPEYGFKLNGKKVLLKGIANHHTLGALGAAAYPRAMEKRLKMLKEFGYNHVRTTHNPYSVSFMDLCDSLGIIVIDEIYDKWSDQFTGGRKPFNELWINDIPEWIKRDRNHPSVVLWSLGNEQQTHTTLPFGDFGVTCYRMMKELVKRYDPTRKLTQGMHPSGRVFEENGEMVPCIIPRGTNPKVNLPSPLALEADIASYNYSYSYFKSDGKNYPNMVFYQSEAGTSDMGRNFFEMDLDKVIGLAYWGQIDYLGESHRWPTKGWPRGTFDISLQPKPQAYLTKAIFTEEPVVHIGIVDQKADVQLWNAVNISTDGLSGHWNRTIGNKYNMKVFTNCERVDIIVNGKKVASKNNSLNPRERNIIKIDSVEYRPGYIEAVGYKDGKKVTSHRIETAGKAEKLTLQPDLETWYANGYDLQHIRITAVDSKGRRAPFAQNKLQFSIIGDAKIVGVDNGNLSSDELHSTNHRSLCNGSALVIIRAGKEPSEVKLKVTSPNFKPQTLILNTQHK